MWDYYKSLYYIGYRDTRLQFLIAYVVTAIVGSIWGFGATFLVSSVLGVDILNGESINPATMSFTMGSIYIAYAILIVYAITTLLIVTWPMTATTIRRLHDHNLSGWKILWALGAWVVLYMGTKMAVKMDGLTVSQIKSIVQTSMICHYVIYAICVYVLCLKRGTKGVNRYGADEGEIKSYLRARRADIKSKIVR